MHKNLSILLFVFISLISNAQNESPGNPLLVHSGQPVQFNKITAPVVVNAVAAIIKLSDSRIGKITAVKSNALSVSNTLMAFDELNYEISDLSMKLQLIYSTYENDSTRNTASAEAEKLSVYSNNLYLNEGLYKALKGFATSAKATQLKPNQEKFLRETLVTFEKNGMQLNAAERKEVRDLNEKIVGLGIEFDKNIAQHSDSIEFSENELKGIPAITAAPWKKPNGKYMVYINVPNYTEVMSNADNEDTRRSMLLRYNNRAFPNNIKVLDSLFYYRNLFAQKLGFKSYAGYALVDKMAAAPAKVWSFENDLVAKLTPYVTKELNDLKQIKHQMHPELADTIYEWDVSYYRKKLLDIKYGLNTDEVKEYFEMNNTLQGLFNVYSKLLNISIKEVKNVPLWYSKVKSYEMYCNGKKIGTFYLDLYPRPNKYTHFACFPISQYRIANGKEVLPVSALVCNFPEGNASQPSLLNHTNVITLFHEFGHLVHSMLGRSDIASQGPFAVKGDFVEAPSQFLENWCWEYESLKLFAKHYKTGEVLPYTLFSKMKQTQLVGIALTYSRQAYLGMLDFTYEDRYESLKEKDILLVSKDLSRVWQVPFTEGSHFITSFGHLNSYGANYYGYVWSKVFAEDMFSVFKKNGVMDTKTGVRYRTTILEKAATKNEMEMLRDFLGREPNSDAFLQSLGIE